MHDRAWIRGNSEALKAGLVRKGMSGPVGDLLRLDEERRALLADLEQAKAEQNRISKSIGQLMGEGKREEAAAAQEATKELKERVRAGEEKQREIEDAIDRIDLQIPNMPHDSVPEGRDENDNRLAREWGEKPSFAEQPAAHWDIAERLGMLDLTRGSKISGSGWAVYTGWGARLQRALF